MSKFPYQRVELPDNSDRTRNEAGPATPLSGRVRWWILPVSVVLCCLQAALTIIGDHVLSVSSTSTLLPIIGFGMLFVLVLIVNPCLQLFQKKSGESPRLNRIELICLFTTLFVTSAFSTFGLAAHLVPFIPAPWNPAWNTPQSGWPDQLTNPDQPLLNPSLYLQDEGALRAFREGVPVQSPPEGSDWAAFGSYYMEVLQQIPWGMWFGPVFYWLIFIFGSLGIFYSLSYVVLRFWVDREKLIFPLAQIPEAILPDDSSRRFFPKIFYRPLFWVGFAFSMLILSWNAATGAGWILPDFAIPLGMTRPSLGSLISGSWVEGLGGGRVQIRFMFVFTAIGIAFLLPTQISFSTWFYFLLSQVMVLIAVWFGVAQNMGDFPSDFYITTSFMTSQGGGALLAFAAISIFRSLKEYYTLALGKTGAERWRLLAPVLWLIGSIGVVMVWLMWNQISLFWAAAFVLFFTLFTIGMMRVVAETGIYFFQANFGFFHAFSVFGLGKLVPATLVAPLMPLYAIFFMDIKTFVPANILVSAKMQKDQGQGRRIFHMNMILCIFVTALFSIGFLIFLAHVRGAQQMSPWFFEHFSKGVLDNARLLLTESAPAFTANGVWVFIGAAWLCLTLWLRKSLFWFPHPIGYILLFNPLLASIWMSFFVGWVFKKITVKYGGKTSFDLLKPVFLGLIFGELLAIFVWLLLGMMLGFASGIDLNRT